MELFKPRCPKCDSSRVRRGYDPTPLLWCALGIRNLLCDNCNLVFKGFAPFGIQKRRRRHRHRENDHSEMREQTHRTDSL